MIKNFCFWDNCIWIGIVKLFLLRTGYFSSAVNVLTSLPKTWNIEKKKLFPTNLTCQWSMNMIKMLWCRFRQWSGTFTMFLFEGSSETGLFRHLPDHVFRVRIFGNRKSMRVIFFFKLLKIYGWFQKCNKKLRKSFFFLR